MSGIVGFEVSGVSGDLVSGGGICDLLTELPAVLAGVAALGAVSDF